MSASILNFPRALLTMRLSTAWRLTIFFGLLFSGTIALLNVAPRAESAYSLAPFWLLTATICAICVVPTILDSGRPEFELVTARNVFVLYCLLLFVFFPVIVYFGEYSTSGTVPLTFFSSRYWEALKGQAYVAIGMFVFQLVYYLRWNRRVSRRSRPNGFILRIQPRKLKPAIFILSSMGVLSFLYLAYSQGGIRSFLANMGDFRDEGMAGTGPIFLGMNLLYFAFVLAYSSYIGNRKHGALALVLFFLTILIGLLGAYRHLAVDTVITAVVIRHYGYRRLKLSVNLCLFIALFIILNLAYVDLRQPGVNAESVELILRNSPVMNTLYYGFFSRFLGPEAMARIIDITPEVGHTGGPLLLLTLATFWVPRAFWPSKPPPMLTYSNFVFFPESFIYFAEGGAVSPTVEGTFYWVAGLAGMVVGMALLAVIFASADKFIVRRRDLFGFAFYANTFIFAAFVSEMVDLHFERFLLRALVWGILFFVCGQKVAVNSRKQYPDYATAEREGAKN